MQYNIYKNIYKKMKILKKLTILALKSHKIQDFMNKKPKIWENKASENLKGSTFYAPLNIIF